MLAEGGAGGLLKKVDRQSIRSGGKDARCLLFTLWGRAGNGL